MSKFCWSFATSKRKEFHKNCALHRSKKLVSKKKMEHLLKYCTAHNLTWWHHSPQHHEIKIFFLYIFRARFSFRVYSLENMANLSLLNNNMIFKGVIMSGVYHMILIFFLFVWRSIFLGCAFKIFSSSRRSICFYKFCQLGTQKYKKDEKRTINSEQDTDMWMKW